MGKEGGEGSVRTSPEGVGGQWVLVVIPGGGGIRTTQCNLLFSEFE